MPSAQDLRERRMNVWTKMEEIFDRSRAENRDPTAEEEVAYDKAAEEFDTLEAQVQRLERHEALTKKNLSVDRSGVIADDDDEDSDEVTAAYGKVFNRFLRNGALDLTAEDRQVLARGQSADKQIKAALGAGTNSAGGYAVPPAFREQIIETMKWYGPMLSLCELLPTETGAAMTWATNDDTSNTGAILTENSQISAQDTTFGQATLNSYVYTSKLILVSWQLLQDRPDIDTFVARKIGQRLGRILNTHFTTGTGSSQPQGIVTGASKTVTGTGSFATTTGIAYSNLVDTIENLDPAYINAADGSAEAPGLTWLMHQSMRKAIRKLTDTQGHPLWEPSLQNGRADYLLGYPARINNDMATLATSSKSLLFGDIRQAYVARVVRDNQVVRLNERYADFLQTGFFGFGRYDGTVQDANAVSLFITTSTA